MKRLILSLTFICMFSASAFAQGGIITGRVIDELGLPMPGASVVLTDLNKGIPTDANGYYTLIEVPAGQHTLTVTFIGYKKIEQTVSVADGATTNLDFTMEAGFAAGGEVIVVGDRLKGQAKALNQQRTNANITNVVAADQIGRFPDANIGDALKRIPGITIQNDQGEARNIIIRGLAPQLNSVTLNGERIPSAEGDNRNIQLDLIPSDLIQTIQVNKAVLPDMDADAIGGSVNLVTRSAPSGRRVS
ncbi:MAG TPA: carboxypeptidase regulatory-like domain-containing protein, partial [Roseivirga sp.]